MADQILLPRLLDANGDPVSGGKVNVYETGTATPVTTYQEVALSTPHANPIIADSEGYFAQAFYSGSPVLKLVFTDAADATLYTLDPAWRASTATAAASAITFAPVTGNAATDTQTAIANIVDGTATLQSLTSVGTVDFTGATSVLGVGSSVCASKDASASGTLDFTEFNSSLYDAYVFVLANIIPATDADIFWIRTSTDGGSTYDSGASDYSYVLKTASHETTPTEAATGALNTTRIIASSAVGNFTDEEGLSGTVWIYGPHLAKRTRLSFDLTYESSATGVYYHAEGSGIRKSSADVDAVRFLFSTGNITSGTITMIGIRNA